MGSNNFFSFKKFIVYHNLCAMKVGTDGVLLGAWAEGGKRVLDIGCGSGLIALMLAQRFPDSHITGIDIDEDAYQQTLFNVKQSPFANQIDVFHIAIQDYLTEECEKELFDGFDAIVCNPPFFINSMKSPDTKRSIARHADTLPFRELFDAVARLISKDGLFSAIIPIECMRDFSAEASLHSFICTRKCFIKTTEKKSVKRVLVTFSKSPKSNYFEEEQVLCNTDGNRSNWYNNLTSDFYLH